MLTFSFLFSLFAFRFSLFASKISPLPPTQLPNMSTAPTLSRGPSSAASSTSQSPNFPTLGLNPKSETRSSNFVNQNPTFDGSGVVIGILDTGVDYECHGLATTTGGAPKLRDAIDCTGAGDVDVSKEVEVKEGFQSELSGRAITGVNLDKIGNPGGRFRIGVKRAYELYPKRLVDRVSAERKKQANEKAAKREADLQKELIQFQKENPGPKLSPAQSKEQADIKAKIKALKDHISNYSDPGPLLDILVYSTPSGDRALISSTGDFASVEPMGAFSSTRDYRRLDHLSMMNYSLSFPSPDTLVITTDTGAHGSHVAGITSAYFPDDPAMSGVAPGAQVVSLKIGDTRLGSMEVGPGIIRALTEAKKLGCHVINMSYGEAAALGDAGRFKDLADELVNKHNILFVASAGNNGPAISTVGAPGGMCSSIISVGAYVSPEMMIGDYSMRETHSGSTYTWSSTGPAPDGDNGVDLIAPGGAISPVPNWCLAKNQLMNGTSMSSPNCCGCIALLLSACIQSGIPYTSARIKKAIFNTAKMMPGLSSLQQGHGMVQVDAAWDRIVAFKDDPSEDVTFKASLNRVLTPRGVYLRQPNEVEKEQTYSVTVEPIFPLVDSPTLESQKEKIDFSMKVNLGQTNTDADWVSFPDHLVLMSPSRNFAIQVDPTKLGPGVHLTRLVLYDALVPSKGAICTIPITVVKPHPLDDVMTPNLGQLNFGPAETRRFFLSPPSGATFMDVTVKDCRPSSDDATSRLIVLHALQLLPHTPYRDNECQRYMQSTPQSTHVFSIDLRDSVTIELTLARYWSAIGFTELSVHVEYRGITPSPSNVLLSTGGAGVRLHSLVRDETASVSAKLTKWTRSLRPKDSSLKPLGTRDLLSGNRQVYEMINTYEITLDESSSLTARAPSLNGFLYESTMEAQMAMFYTSGKKLLGVSDCWPDSVKCPKGTITIRFSIRHDKVSLLEDFKDMVLLVERAIKSSIELTTYSSHENMINKSGKFGKRALQKGNMAYVHFAPPADSKMPKGSEPGDVLVGTATYEYKDSSLPGNGCKPKAYEVTYIVPPAAPKKKDEKPAVREVKDERNEIEKMEEDLRDWKVKRVEKMVGEEKFDELYENLVKEYPDHLPLLTLKLKHLDKDNSGRSDRLSSIVTMADSIISLIDQNALALWSGVKQDLTDGTVVKQKEKMDILKGSLTEALGRKCRALVDSRDKSADALPPAPAAEGDTVVVKEPFEEALTELKKWVKVEGNDKYAALEFELYRSKNQRGNVLSLISKLGEGDSTKGGIREYSKSELCKMKGEVYKEMGWDDMAEYETINGVLEGMKSFSPF